MSVASEIRHLTIDLESIEALLEKLPASRVLERVGFEARRDEVREQLTTLEVSAATPERSVTPPGARLAEEVRKLDALLAGLPASRVLERAGLERRRDELRSELARTREITPSRLMRRASAAAVRRSAPIVIMREAQLPAANELVRVALLAAALAFAALDRTALLKAVLLIFLGVEVSRFFVMRRDRGDAGKGARAEGYVVRPLRFGKRSR